MRWRSPSPDATRWAAAALARLVDARGLVVALVGPLGVGKTVFAKGLAEGLGLDSTRVASPTFVIACEYASADGRRLAHVDCYRVESVAELEGAGFLDLLEPGVLVAVEWANRFPGALPADHLEVALMRDSSSSSSETQARVLDVQAHGPGAEAVLARWREALAVA